MESAAAGPSSSVDSTRSASTRILNTSKSKRAFDEEEDTNENPVLSVDNLTQWLINFSSTAARLLRKNTRFFRDEFNVLRDSQWREVRESENPMAAAATIGTDQSINSVVEELNFKEIQSVLDKTGCISLPVVLFEQDRAQDIKRYEKSARRRSSARNIPKLEEDKEAGGVYRRHCLFLSDWQRLWNFLKHDTQDEVAQHAPYLRTCVEFFFHRRTVQMMYFLVGWNLGVSILAQILFPDAIPVYTMNFNYAYYIFQLAVYLTACLMNKGTLPKFFEVNPFRRVKKKNGAEAFVKPDVDEKLVLNSREHHVHWGSTAQQMVRKTGSEVLHFFQTAKEEAEGNRNFSRRGMYYYKWMNMMLKVLVRLEGIELEKTNFNRQIYRFVLIFSTVFFPLYAVLITWQSNVLPLVTSCADNTHSSECRYFYVLMAGTAGFFTLWLQYVIYGASILISLSGLAYGGEIAYRLADAWLQKYGCLRRVDDVDSCYVDRDAINKGQGAEFNEQESKKREQLGKALRIANGFRVSSSGTAGSESETKEEASKRAIVEEGAKEIAGLISRDATEQYLFIREAMNTAGRIWSPVITGLIFLAIFIATAEVYAAYYATTRGYNSIYIFIRITAFVITRILILVFYPIVSIATANAYLLKIGDVFRVSAEEDYEVIGGRDRWLDFLEKFPAVWTYYGVYVTPERLAGIAWTTFIAFLSVVFTALASTSL
eukprot:gene10165-7250_t